MTSSAFHPVTCTQAVLLALLDFNGICSRIGNFHEDKNK